MKEHIINLSSEDVIVQVGEEKKLIERSRWRLGVFKGRRQAWSPMETPLWTENYKFYVETPEGKKRNFSDNWRELLRLAYTVAYEQGKVKKELGYWEEEKIEDFFYIIVDKEVIDAIGKLRMYSVPRDAYNFLRAHDPVHIIYFNMFYGGYVLCYVDKNTLVV